MFGSSESETEIDIAVFPSNYPIIAYKKSNQQLRNYRADDIIPHSLDYLFDWTVSNFSN